jgi:phosphate/sulfate permease
MIESNTGMDPAKMQNDCGYSPAIVRVANPSTHWDQRVTTERIHWAWMMTIPASAILAYALTRIGQALGF